MHKSYLALLLLALIATTSWGQVYLNYSVNQPPALSAHAGNDQLICPGGQTDIGALPAAIGGYGGYQYQWSPGTNLNNAQIGNPIAFPSTSTTYILTVTDSLGCTDFDSVEVVVDTCIGTLNQLGVEAFEVIPNPNDGKFVVDIRTGNDAAELTLTVVDLHGREVFRRAYPTPGRNLRTELRLEGLSRGSYFIRLEADGHSATRKMIIR
ncbi:MAG: T9SS type A sorting domain-containing protein [Bacteroidia bacterium]